MYGGGGMSDILSDLIKARKDIIVFIGRYIPKLLNLQVIRGK